MQRSPQQIWNSGTTYLNYSITLPIKIDISDFLQWKQTKLVCFRQYFSWSWFRDVEGHFRSNILEDMKERRSFSHLEVVGGILKMWIIPSFNSRDLSTYARFLSRQPTPSESYVRLLPIYNPRGIPWVPQTSADKTKHTPKTTTFPFVQI